MGDARSSAEVEREIERSRAEIRHTIDRIQEQLSPGQLLDQALGYVRERRTAGASRNGGESRLGRAVRENPVAVLMVGAGLAWLAAAVAGMPDRQPRAGARPGDLMSTRRGSMSRSGPGPSVMSASSLIGDSVVNLENESLGKIEDIMLDMESGRIAYAVLSFGGVVGIGSKLFALPWRALQLDPPNKRFVLDMSKEQLKSAPGFDKDDWPKMADPHWARDLHGHYGASPYWED